MLDHVSFGVTDLVRSVAFYDVVLGPLGFVRVWIVADAAGYGLPGGDDAFAVKYDPGIALHLSARSHIAFAASSRSGVIAFHAAALTLGARDEGAPALYPEYGTGYFAAFVRDPDGYRLEAVRHE